MYQICMQSAIQKMQQFLLMIGLKNNKDQCLQWVILNGTARLVQHGRYATTGILRFQWDKTVFYQHLSERELYSVSLLKHQLIGCPMVKFLVAGVKSQQPLVFSGTTSFIVLTRISGTEII